MKRLIACLLILGAGCASAAEFSGNVTYTTDYRFRGISQGDRSQALQGGFDIEFENGAYLGTWASNVTFSGAAIEVDYYGGYAWDVNDDLAADVGVLWYNYPEDDAVDLDGIGDRDLDFVEIYGSLSFMDATVGLAYSPDYYYETDSYIYLYGDYSYAINDDWSLDFHYALNLFDDEEIGADFGIGRCSAVAANGECLRGTEDSYADWSIGISTSWSGLDFGLQYIDTDLHDKDCFGNTQLCDATAVISVSKSL